MFKNWLSNPIVQKSHIIHNLKDASHLDLNYPKMKNNI